MKFTAISFSILVASALAEPRLNLQARATNSLESACSSSGQVYETSEPTATDKPLSSWLAMQTTTVAVPTALQKAYCTYDASRASWARSTAAPYLSKCSALLDKSFASSLRSFLSTYTTTATWCASVTANAAMPRETAGFGAGVVAAAGLVAAIL